MLFIVTDFKKAQVGKISLKYLDRHEIVAKKNSIG
jgi:hypothetical protein